MSTQDLIDEVLRLPRRDRVEVANRLLRNLEQATDDVTAEWVSELERRSREIGEQQVQAVSWELPQQGIRETFKRRRAGPASS